MDSDYQYCPHCGQKDTSKIASVKGLIMDFLGDYFTFDSKIFKSLIPLVVNPGHLTNEYIAGKRISYIPPLRLYLFISIFFFILFAQLNPRSSVEVAGDNISQDLFDFFIDQHMHKVLFILLPVFGGILYLMFRKTYGNYFIHFIFSLHYHAFLFIVLGVYLLITSILTSGMYQVNQWLFVAFQLLFVLYLYSAIKKVYKKSLLSTLIRSVVISFLYGVSFLAISIASFALYYFWKT